MKTPSQYAAKMRTPFCVLGIRTADGKVTGIEYLSRSERKAAPADPVAKRVVKELERYFADPRYRMSLPLAPRGTPFQRRVWDAIAAIPVGESRTYGDIARTVHSAPRAVGQACGDNPIPLIIPCHRVVAADGSLGGFMHSTGGDPIAIKRWLLAHEGARVPA